MTVHVKVTLKFFRRLAAIHHSTKWKLQPLLAYLLLSSDEGLLCPQTQWRAPSAIPESCPLEWTDVIDFSKPLTLLDLSLVAYLKHIF